MDSNEKQRELPSKTSSLISVNPRPIPSKSDDSLDENGDDTIQSLLKSNSSSDQLPSNNDHRNAMITKRPCSLTQMLLIYAQQEIDSANSANQNLKNILNVLELHFNTYADEKHEIYFEGIFQILLDFKEQITESALIETMQLLQVERDDLFRRKPKGFSHRSILLIDATLKIFFLFYAIYHQLDQIIMYFSMSSMNSIITKIPTSLSRIFKWYYLISQLISMKRLSVQQFVSLIQIMMMVVCLIWTLLRV